MPKKIDVSGLDHYHDKVSAMLASEYSSSKTYAVGDYCFHAGTLYECTTAITTAENWTAGHWTAAKLAEDTSALKNAIDSDTEIVYNQYARKTASWAKNFGSATVVNVGDDEIQGTNAVIDSYAYNGLIQNFVVGHKYLIICIASKQGGSIGLYSYISDTVSRSAIPSTGADNAETLLSIINTATRTGQEYNVQLRIYTANVSKFMFKQVRCFDLTEMKLESIETVEEFVAIFPEWYNIENTGETRYLTRIEENAYNIAKLDKRVSTLEALVLENIGG